MAAYSPSAIREYTVRTFTPLVDEAINGAKAGDENRVKNQLTKLKTIVIGESIADFEKFILAMLYAVRNNKLNADKTKPPVWPDAKAVTESIDKWYETAKKRGFKVEQGVYLKNTLAELTTTELETLVGKLLEGTASDDDKALYDRVIVFIGVPDFINDSAVNEEASSVAARIIAWQKIYRQVSIGDSGQPQTDDEKRLETLKKAVADFANALAEVKEKVKPNDEDEFKSNLQQSDTHMKEAAMWAARAIGQSETALDPNKPDTSGGAGNGGAGAGGGTSEETPAA